MIDGWLVPEKKEAIIITEYCDQGTVEDRLGADESFVWQVIFQTAFALMQTSLVHLDIKTENLFLTKRRGQILVKVGDWGEANQGTDRVGTKLYQAPELWGKNREHSDQRVDVFALGVVAYRLMTGEYPFSSIEELKSTTVVADK